MALYRWATKLAWIWSWFAPTNSWTTGQVLTKTAWWYDWETIDALPSGGTTWQVLTKTASWADWETVDALPSGGTAGQVLTKTTSWADWETPTWWIDISSQANNILTAWAKIWAGTESNYEGLSTYDDNTLYMTIE